MNVNHLIANNERQYKDSKQRQSGVACGEHFSIGPLHCSNPDLFHQKQNPLWNMSKRTQTYLYPTHNKDKLCMYAASGDTKHYSKSIQPLGLCMGRREAPALPLWSKDRAEALSILASQKLVPAFCASWISRGSQGLATQGSESPQALFDTECSVSFPP